MAHTRAAATAASNRAALPVSVCTNVRQRALVWLDRVSLASLGSWPLTRPIIATGAGAARRQLAATAVYP
ncbi:hypothetical protein GCM10010321_51610 [Streptomyces chartreusis]|nr:hypothetical protein GCM10010321_51610 [Streptomyces chartreusis]